MIQGQGSSQRVQGTKVQRQGFPQCQTYRTGAVAGVGLVKRGRAVIRRAQAVKRWLPRVRHKTGLTTVMRGPFVARLFLIVPH